VSPCLCGYFHSFLTQRRRPFSAVSLNALGTTVVVLGAGSKLIAEFVLCVLCLLLFCICLYPKKKAFLCVLCGKIERLRGVSKIAHRRFRAENACLTVETLNQTCAVRIRNQGVLRRIETVSAGLPGISREKTRIVSPGFHGCERHALCSGGFVEVLDHVAAALLGLVERAVGFGNQVFGRFHVFLEHRDSATYRHFDLLVAVAAEGVGLDRLAYAFRDCDCAMRIDVGKQHAHLLAAVSVGRVVVAYLLLYYAGDLAQDYVA